MTEKMITSMFLLDHLSIQSNLIPLPPPFPPIFINFPQELNWCTIPQYFLFLRIIYSGYQKYSLPDSHFILVSVKINKSIVPNNNPTHGILTFSILTALQSTPQGGNFNMWTHPPPPLPSPEVYPYWTYPR